MKLFDWLFRQLAPLHRKTGCSGHVTRCNWLRNVAKSSRLFNVFAIFRCVVSCREGVLHALFLLQLASQWRCITGCRLQKNLPCVTFRFMFLFFYSVSLFAFPSSLSLFSSFLFFSFLFFSFFSYLFFSFFSFLFFSFLFFSFLFFSLLFFSFLSSCSWLSRIVSSCLVSSCLVFDCPVLFSLV